MKELSKSYEAKILETKWYDFWEKKGFFHASTQTNKPTYSLVMPPPNVTGRLHMGHALVSTLQDVLVRWHRMKGFETLWVPGTDHAGIATQTVVERHLIKTLGKKRKDFSREEFLGHVWKWKEENSSLITNQLRKLGCSCDWERERFTMDPGCNKAVRTIFKKLFDNGLIYRDNYLVNWDPVTRTALADDEVEYEERKGWIWYFKYPLEDGSGFARIATTRPETMLGDTAVAVSPKDPRYVSWVGKNLLLPITNRTIPIVADHLVDPEFGTGMVKVTPAHDPNDYQIGLRQNLPFINIMTPEGKINENGLQFEGLSMEEARKGVVAKMEELGLLEKVEPHTNRVGVSYRSKATIEPWMSKQWFVKMESFGQRLKEIIQTQEFRLIPKNWENTYFHWINNLRDWCISRQLWWGHRIPIWYNIETSEMICWDGEGAPPETHKDPQKWVQDEDVLDTWFSSALWPFSTLGWPDNTAELKRFYPTSVLVTGHDILFFWVARMLFMGEYAMQKLPFPEAYLHGLIYGKSYWRDQPGGGISYLSSEERHEYEMGKPLPKEVHFKWEKMSKTKGNIIDPLEIIDLYGTDAMRMALCSSATHAREIDLDLRKFEEYKNFTNKVWNGARFVFMNLEGLTAEEFAKGLQREALRLEDRWILSVLNQTIQGVNQKLGEYMFDQATMQAYEFYWNDFCSYYVEIAKPFLFGKQGNAADKTNKQKILLIVLCQAVRLLHPMAPFITEELFQNLKEFLPDLQSTEAADPYTREAITALRSEGCIVAPFPSVIREEDIDPDINEAFSLVGRAVYVIRNIRGEMKLPPGTATDIYLLGNEKDAAFQKLKSNLAIISALIRTNTIQAGDIPPKCTFFSTGMLDNCKIIIPLPQELAQQEETRLKKEKEKLLISIDKLRNQLANQDFVKNAPGQLVDKQKATLSQAEKDLEELSAKLNSL